MWVEAPPTTYVSTGLVHHVTDPRHWFLALRYQHLTSTSLLLIKTANLGISHMDRLLDGATLIDSHTCVCSLQF